MPNLHMAKEIGYLRYFVRRAIWKMNAAITRRTFTMTLPTGGQFPLPHRSYYASDIFVTRANVDWNSEYILARYLRSLDEPGDFLDVGAHIGYYTALIAPIARQCHAFEPDSRNAGSLRAAVANLQNVEIVQQAVADAEGEGFLDASPESSISHLTAAGTLPHAEPVRITTVDAFCGGRPGMRVSAVKIDIEGFDILALEGAQQTARTHRTVFLTEFGTESGRPNSMERLAGFLQRNDYALYAVSRLDSSPFQYRFSFDRFETPKLGEVWTKMLFIVPQECAFFPNLADHFPEIARTSLSPRDARGFVVPSPENIVTATRKTRERPAH
jgi:FkbM family methyltransferase